MKRPYLLSPFFFLCLQVSFAQYYEAGMTFGGANYVGDLSEQRFDGQNFGGMMGMFVRHNFTNRVSAKVSLAKGSISANDATARSEANRMRNLHFRSDILEFSVTGEFNLQPYNIRAKQTGVPYFFGGIALTHFNPQAQMRGSWYDLQPLRTEGNNYRKNILAIPFGLGMKFNISYKLNFGFEIGARKTFTDYLDDVSSEYPDIISLKNEDPTAASLAYRTPEITGEFGNDPSGLERGNSGNNDWYMFMGATVSINLTDKYGLDFDKKYEVFKEHLFKAKEEKKLNRKNAKAIRKAERLLAKKRKNAKYKQKRRKLFAKKKMLQPQIKKRTNDRNENENDKW